MNCSRRGTLLRTVALWLALSSLQTVSAQADDALASQRETFRQVMDAQAAGRHAQARHLAATIEDYPLHPYFRYGDLRRRLRQLPEADVGAFLAAHDSSYLGQRLRAEWLRELARQQQWELYLRYYRPQDDVALQCLQLVARIRSSRLEGVLDDTKAVWLSGTSRPDECDPAFARLYASDAMSDDLAWQRIRLAMELGNTGLARFTATRLRDAGRRAAAERWLLAHKDPAAVLRRRDLGNDADAREIAVYAVGRLAQRDVDAARAAWAEVSARLRFDDVEAGRAARALAIAAAGSGHPDRIALLDAVPAASVDVIVEAYRLREGIALQAWEPLSRWTETTGEETEALRRRYWRSQALAHLGRDTEARTLLQELARERDYYGFLAADKLHEDYAFNFVPVAPTRSEIGAVVARPGIARARELYLLNRRTQARREWTFELARMERREQEVAAAVVAGWGWPDSAIAALGRAASYDDLHLRFPLLHLDLVQKYALERGLDAARVLAIIRAESAFATDAVSPAGALGLMQVMPQTARETARRVGVALKDDGALILPQTNIAIGTVYLQRMIARFGGNFVMAAAAYNAGPGRVRQWQGSACVPADRWIDTIPFPETRAYVRRALFYTAVYQWRLERPVTKLDAIMTPIPAAASSATEACSA